MMGSCLCSNTFCWQIYQPHFNNMLLRALFDWRKSQHWSWKRAFTQLENDVKRGETNINCFSFIPSRSLNCNCWSYADRSTQYSTYLQEENHCECSKIFYTNNERSYICTYHGFSIHRQEMLFVIFIFSIFPFVRRCICCVVTIVFCSVVLLDAVNKGRCCLWARLITHPKHAHSNQIYTDIHIFTQDRYIQIYTDIDKYTQINTHITTPKTCSQQPDIHRYTQIYTDIYRNAQIYTDVYIYTQIYTTHNTPKTCSQQPDIHKYTQISIDMHKCTLIYTDIHAFFYTQNMLTATRYTQICTNITDISRYTQTFKTIHANFSAWFGCLE